MSDLTKAADDVIELLQKALGDEDEKRVEKAVKKADDEEMPVDEDEYDEDEAPEEESEESEEEEPVAKSIYDEIQEEHADYLDVSPLLDQMAKSMGTLGQNQAQSDKLLKAVAQATLTNSQILKSLLDEPEVRKSVLHKRERNFGGDGGVDQKPTGDRRVMLTQINKALRDGNLTMRQASIAEDRINKGMELPAEVGTILKSM